MGCGRRREFHRQRLFGRYSCQGSYHRGNRAYTHRLQTLEHHASNRSGRRDLWAECCRSRSTRPRDGICGVHLHHRHRGPRHPDRTLGRPQHGLQSGWISGLCGWCPIGVRGHHPVGRSHCLVLDWNQLVERTLRANNGQQWRSMAFECRTSRPQHMAGGPASVSLGRGHGRGWKYRNRHHQCRAYGSRYYQSRDHRSVTPAGCGFHRALPAEFRGHCRRSRVRDRRAEPDSQPLPSRWRSRILERSGVGSRRHQSAGTLQLL